MTEPIRVEVAALERATAALFRGLGLPGADAALVAEALVEADLLGVSSHGVSNYIRAIYAPGLRDGSIAAQPEITVVRDTPVSAVLDGGGGMGHVVGRRAMDLAISKARATGMGMVAVRNSRHFGMAGHYALRAAEAGMIGLSLTDSGRLVLPTHGRESRLGTNPIAVALPGGEKPPFLLDMATSTVPLGKVMLHERAGVPIPEGWAADEQAQSTTDAAEAVTARRLFGLGGAGELLGGHKGYGLSALVDLLCGVLPGGDPRRPDTIHSAVGHFFAAVRVDLFAEPQDFRDEVDAYLRYLRGTPSAEGEPPVIYPGVKEARARAEREAHGVPLHPEVVDFLRELAAELGVDEVL